MARPRDSVELEHIWSYIAQRYYHPATPVGRVFRVARLLVERELESIRADKAEAKLAEMQAEFDLRWKADMRAIEQWKEAHLVSSVWPDHADMVVWLLARADKAEAGLAELGRMLNEACWAIDHTCTQCGEQQPAHTPRCPTYLALAKWEASRVK